MNNEEQIKALVENWAGAVRDKDLNGIMAWHHQDIVMYDVPPPFKSVGLEAYKKTWDLFYSCEQGENSFQIADIHVIAGEEVAFCYTDMTCAYFDIDKRWIDLDFRLTIGFKKIDGKWWFIHEHHSVPAE